MTADDPFAIQPHLWFGLLCEEVNVDQNGRIDLRRTFNRIRFYEPSPDSGVPPHARLNGLLVLGYSAGIGNFMVTIDMVDADDNVLWKADEPWSFSSGPGETAASVHGLKVEHWFSQPGHYRFRLRLTPGAVEHQIHFEVTTQGGHVLQADQPTDSPES